MRVVELALNLGWLLLAGGSALAWVIWRRSSASDLVPELSRGLLVIGCIFAILLPAVSITDDLAQGPLLAERVKMDTLEGPKQLIIQVLTSIVLVQAFFPLRTTAVFSWKTSSSHG